MRMAGAKTKIICSVLSSSSSGSSPYLAYGSRAKCFICLVSPKTIMVVQNYQRKEVITYPSEILDVCLWEKAGFHEEDDKLVWWSLTDHNIWLSTPSHHKKQLNKDESQSMGTDTDIFSDLLQAEDLIQTVGESRSPPTDCGSRVLVGIHGARKLLIYGQRLVLLIQNESDWLLRFYHVQVMDGVIDTEIQGTVLLSNLHSSSQNSSISNPSHSQDVCQLYVMISASTHTDISSSDKTKLVSTRLFSYLFGTDSSLVDMPMCLVTTPTGVIYAAPCISQHQSALPTIIMDLAEPVVALFTLTVLLKLIQGEPKLIIQPASCDERSGNCLLVVGRNGKLHIMLSIEPTAAKNKESTPQVVSEVCVLPGPVRCAGVCSNILVHSTGRELYLSDMTAVLSRLVDQSTDVYLPLKNQPQGISNVVKLAIEVPSMASKDKLTEVPCLAVTSKGRMLQLTASFHEQTRSNNLPGHSPGGSIIKDVLTSIGRVSDLMTNIHDKLKQQNNVLQQLHIASLIASKYPQNDTDVPDMPCLCNVIMNSRNSPLVISWGVQVTESHSGERSCSFVLRVMPQNICLGSGWRVIVSIIEDPLNSSSGEAVHSKLVELSHLSSGEFSDVHMNLDKAMCNDWKLPILVCTTLVYQFQQDSESTGKCSNEYSSNGLVHVPVPNITLDSVHFLQSVRSTSLQILQQICDPQMVLEALSRDRCCHDLHITKRSDDHQVKGQGSYCSTIVITAAQKTKLTLKSEAELLQWLFKETDIQTCGTTIRVTSPLGHQATFSIQSPDGSTYHIDIQTQQMALLSQLESSIKRRLKVLEIDQHTVSTVQIQKALANIQAIQRDVEQVQVTPQPGSNPAVVKQLLTAHQKLNDIQL